MAPPSASIVRPVNVSRHAGGAAFGSESDVSPHHRPVGNLPDDPDAINTKVEKDQGTRPGKKSPPPGEPPASSPKRFRVEKIKAGKFRAGASPAPTFQVNILHRLLQFIMLICGACERSIDVTLMDEPF